MDKYNVKVSLTDRGVIFGCAEKLGFPYEQFRPLFNDVVVSMIDNYNSKSGGIFEQARQAIKDVTTKLGIKPKGTIYTEENFEDNEEE